MSTPVVLSPVPTWTRVSSRRPWTLCPAEPYLPREVHSRAPVHPQGSWRWPHARLVLLQGLGRSAVSAGLPSTPGLPWAFLAERPPHCLTQPLPHPSLLSSPCDALVTLVPWPDLQEQEHFFGSLLAPGLLGQGRDQKVLRCVEMDECPATVPTEPPLNAQRTCGCWLAAQSRPVLWKTVLVCGAARALAGHMVRTAGVHCCAGQTAGSPGHMAHRALQSQPGAR